MVFAKRSYFQWIFYNFFQKITHIISSLFHEKGGGANSRGAINARDTVISRHKSLNLRNHGLTDEWAKSPKWPNHGICSQKAKTTLLSLRSDFRWNQRKEKRIFFFIVALFPRLLRVYIKKKHTKKKNTTKNSFTVQRILL